MQIKISNEKQKRRQCPTDGIGGLRKNAGCVYLTYFRKKRDKKFISDVKFS